MIERSGRAGELPLFLQLLAAPPPGDHAAGFEFGLGRVLHGLEAYVGLRSG